MQDDKDLEDLLDEDWEECDLEDNDFEEPKSTVEKIWDYTVNLVIHMAIFVFLVLLIFMQQVHISGNSMQPTFQDGQYVWTQYYREYTHLKAGDVIVFTIVEPEETRSLIKRVVAMPGDTVQIIDQKLYVNGDAQDYGDFDAMEYAGLAAELITLGEDEYFVLGDNRNHSYDSRMIGPIKQVDITHKVGWR